MTSASTTSVGLTQNSVNKNKIHFASTGIKHAEFRSQLRVNSSHIIDHIRGDIPVNQKHLFTLFKNLGSCKFESTFVYHTNRAEIIKHFARVFFKNEYMNNHLRNRTLEIKFYDSRGWEYIIVDRNPKSE